MEKSSTIFSHLVVAIVVYHDAVDVMAENFSKKISIIVAIIYKVMEIKVVKVVKLVVIYPVWVFENYCIYNN